MKDVILKVKEIVKERMINEASGHDYWHVIRVYNNAMLLLEKLNEEEIKPNKSVVELAALLHDLGDYKITGSEETATEIPRQILQQLGVEKDIVEAVVQIIGEISYHQQTLVLSSIEAEIVQDADRLDAIGALGIARAFAYGGAKKREIWNPEKPAKPNMTKEEYMKNQGSSINHFYEKLLTLYDKMNTKVGREIARNRHEFMEHFLEQFYAEWNGDR